MDASHFLEASAQRLRKKFSATGGCLLIFFGDTVRTRSGSLIKQNPKTVAACQKVTLGLLAFPLYRHENREVRKFFFFLLSLSFRQEAKHTCR
jgi:hypothetical protein